MLKSATLLVLAALATLVSSDFPVDGNIERISTYEDEDFVSYRVPEDVDPIHFEVEITPYFEDAPQGKQNFTFDGVVKINLKAIKDNIGSIYIQENVREIGEVSLYTVAVPPLISVYVPIADVKKINGTHFLRIDLVNNVTLVNEQEYLLTINYVGNINETPLQRGVFRGNYKDENGTVHWYAATHLQPVNSRQAFPCFDEPGFKSTFDIIINRPAHFGETYSNMPIKETVQIGERIKEIFHRTPRMSAYLVTFHISEAFTVIADNNNSVRPFRILARPIAVGQGEYALRIGPLLTISLERFFGIDYYNMSDYMKNDHIASPYWASGATENWGLVTYREHRLLYEEGETNILDKMSIRTIIAHELAHKWFGNFITTKWWDNVWINEGFASYFEYFALDGLEDRAMELADQFILMYMQSALSADSSLNTRALQHNVSSPAEVTTHFSGISYSKGAALLVMLKNIVGEVTFQKALQYLLKDRSYNYAVADDVYDAFFKAALEHSGLSQNFVRYFVRNWVEQPGYPVVNVILHPSLYVTLRQERFFVDPTVNTTDQVWPLPVTFTSSENPNFRNLKPREIMFGPQSTFMHLVREPSKHWFIFNLQQQGMYRVNYEPVLWERIAAQLQKDHEVIHHLNRAQIVDDIFAFMRSEKVSHDLGFKVISFLKKDSSYYSWYPAITGFTWLRNRLLHLPEALSDFDKTMVDYLDKVVKDIGYDVVTGERATVTLNRIFVLNFACNVGHEGCIQNAMEKFKALKNNGTRVDPNIRRHVFCQGILAGGYDKWKFIYDRRQNSNNQADDVAMLRSLGCTTNDQARQEYLNMILDDDVVKAQDRLNAFTFLMMGHRSNANVTLQFFKQNINEIRKAVVLQTWFDSIISNIADYLDETGLNDMESWLQANQNSIPEYSVGISSINSARKNQAWGTENADIVVKAARGSAITILPSAMLLLFTCLALLLR